MRLYLTCIIVVFGLLPMLASAAPPSVLPGSADAGRIRPEERAPQIEHEDDNAIAIPEGGPLAEAPESAKSIHFVLNEVDVEGATVFSQDELKNIYAQYLGKEITLDVAWVIAGGITERYRANGYFLSRAYVPAQSVKGGKLVIKVVEGYIGSVELQDDKANNYVVGEYIDDLKTRHPVKTSEMESFLLRLNDLPGLSFRAILSAEPNREEANKGAVKLTLVPSDKAGKGAIGFDNYGSRFLGPNEVTATYQGSIIPLENTLLSGVTSTPTHELKSGMLTQSAVIFPNMTLELSGGYTKAFPGFNLKQYEIESQSTSLGVALNYQLLRQRNEDLSFRLSLDGRNTNSDILETPLTRDRVRAVRAGVSFDAGDSWYGFTAGSFTVSRGLDILGASDEGDLNLSRSDADPEFTKAEFSLSRLQGITDEWAIFAAASGQISSDPLFSSEEYGFGGQAFGRAYDSSQITGDDGIAGSIELRYNGFASLEPVGFAPYIFYDIGEVWQQGSSSTESSSTSGSSAGLGVRFTTDFHLSGNLGLAFPLTLPATTPIYGYANKRNPRILLQVSQEF